MEPEAILNLWKAQDSKVEQLLSLNKRNTQELLRLKTKSVLSGMKPIKIFTLAVGILWVLLGSIILSYLFRYAYDEVSLFFLYSAAAQLLLTAIAVFIYGYQLIMIHQVDISDTVMVTQKKLAYLKASTLWSAKVLFLQLPLWTTFYLSKEAISSGNMPYLLINGMITALFTYAAFWLFLNVNYKNKDKKWFKLLFNGREWTPVIRSIEFYKEMELYENPN